MAKRYCVGYFSYMVFQVWSDSNTDSYEEACDLLIEVDAELDYGDSGIAYIVDRQTMLIQGVNMDWKADDRVTVESTSEENA